MRSRTWLGNELRPLILLALEAEPQPAQLFRRSPRLPNSSVVYASLRAAQPTEMVAKTTMSVTIPIGHATFGIRPAFRLANSGIAPAQNPAHPPASGRAYR